MSGDVTRIGRALWKLFFAIAAIVTAMALVGLVVRLLFDVDVTQVALGLW